MNCHKCGKATNEAWVPFEAFKPDMIGPDGRPMYKNWRQKVYCEACYTLKRSEIPDSSKRVQNEPV